MKNVSGGLRIIHIRICPAVAGCYEAGRSREHPVEYHNRFVSTWIVDWLDRQKLGTRLVQDFIDRDFIGWSERKATGDHRWLERDVDEFRPEMVCGGRGQLDLAFERDQGSRPDSPLIGSSAIQPSRFALQSVFATRKDWEVARRLGPTVKVVPEGLAPGKPCTDVLENALEAAILTRPDDGTQSSRHLSRIETMGLTAVLREVSEGYVAFVEEIPGADTQGATLQEARENLKEPVELVLAPNRELSLEAIGSAKVIREPLKIVG